MTVNNLPALPVGMYDFANLRSRGFVYVDKSALLMSLADGAGRIFLSRPRRFGKSLTLSTLDAMFSGKAKLFQGLAAELWVQEQAKHPCPVVRIDFGLLNNFTTEELDAALRDELARIAAEHNVTIVSKTLGGVFKDVIVGIYRRSGPVVLLVDEYDKPVLDHLDNVSTAEAMRALLRSFYTVIKGCEPYLRFVMLTGISKFTKMGVFSAINNLSDISMDERYGALCGYTQEELESCFSGWIGATAEKMDLSRGALLDRIREYYDGFCFDGRTKVYNPFSTLQLFDKGEFRNYWYESASPWFISRYIRDHGALSTEEFRHVRMGVLQIGAQEIERAEPASFLLQSGYLTIEKLDEDMLTLDYPNKEVRTAMAAMFLYHACGLKSYAPIGNDLWKALRRGNLDEVKRLFNAAMAGIPYDVWEKLPRLNEALFQSYFLMLLEGAGLQVAGEVESSRGRSDVEVRLTDRVYIFEFKAAKDEHCVEYRRAEGESQIESRGYAEKYAADKREIIKTTFVIDLKKRLAV